jgi:hypothetical protein
LALPDASMAAYVSNLPFGQQYGVDGPMDRWLHEVLRESVRVTRPDGRVVLLAPSIPRPVVPPALILNSRHQIRLLGVRTTLWAYARRG